MDSTTIALGGGALIVGLILVTAARLLRPQPGKIVDVIDAMLPQTQCGQCDYAGCRPYAQAMAEGTADINQCPPGGHATMLGLAKLLGREPRPIDPARGLEKPREVALIDEDLCIGCKKCILVCPVDAIVGAPKLMHTVLSAECTGCDLCPPVCPVDCIDMVPPRTGVASWRPKAPQREPASGTA